MNLTVSGENELEEWRLVKEQLEWIRSVNSRQILSLISISV